MNRNLVAIAVVIASLNLLANAGTISGKVSGASGNRWSTWTRRGKNLPRARPHPLVDQKGSDVPSPHIIVVQQGTTVDFLNSDNVAHNVFWTSVGGDKKAGHNLGTWPRARSVLSSSITPAPCRCSAMCTRKWRAISSCAPTPYFAETDEAGEYKIKNVPDGSYTVTAWHEGAKNQSKPVTVAGDTQSGFHAEQVRRIGEQWIDLASAPPFFFLRERFSELKAARKSSC